MALRSNDITIFEIAAGTGMFSAAIELAFAAVGMRARTIGYCERDAAAAAALVARMENKTLHPAPIWDDAWTLDCEPWRGAIDLLCAGYLCQPFSSAGKRLGHRDPRHLWPAVRRAIAGVKPGIVFLENVDAHVRLGGGKVIRDLQRLGYMVTAGLFSSAECGASHQRKRLFILGVADAHGARTYQPQTSGSDETGTVAAKPGDSMANAKRNGRSGNGRMPWTREKSDATDSGESMGNAGSKGLESRKNSASQRIGATELRSGNVGDSEHGASRGGKVPKGKLKRRRQRFAAGSGNGQMALPRYAPARNDLSAWAAVASLDASRMPSIESSLRGMADGLAPWADQLRLVGNGVDPLVAAYAFLSLFACIE